MLRRSRADEFGKCRPLPADNERVQRAPSVADAEMSTAVDDVLTDGMMAIWSFGVWIMSAAGVAHVENSSVVTAARTPAWIRSVGMWRGRCR